MIRLITVTLAGLYVAMLVAPESVEAENTEVSRQNSMENYSFSLASFVAPQPAPTNINDMPSDEEAIQLALAAGAAIRADREAPRALRGLIEAVETEPTVAEVEAVRELWSVSGTLVNLREGPSTGNDVVAQLTLGTTAEVIGEDDGWYQIETSDGATSGWIFGKFLQPET